MRNEMTHWIRNASIMLLPALALAAVQPASAQQRYRGNGPGCCLSAPAVPANPEEAKSLAHMREEEKLARDVYRLFYQKWNLAIFNNISLSEDRHFEAVGKLLARYGVPDPAENRLPGEYSDPDLQALYAELTVKGSASVHAALEVGVLIEELDIKDLETALTQTGKFDIKRVYTNLLNGSFNHLEAFETVLGILTPAAPPAQ
jgi:hypothetical protein